MRLPGLLREHFVASSPLLAAVPEPLRRDVWTRLATSERHRFVYVRLPKAANSTIVRTLAAHVFPDERARVEADGTGQYAKSLFGPPAWWRAVSRDRLLASYTVFSFFRNPYDRVLSAFLDKMIAPRDPGRFAATRQRVEREGAGALSFDGFLAYLENGGLHANPHWAPQTALCPVDPGALHHLGKIERLERDLREVLAALGTVEFRGLVTREANRHRAAEKRAALYDAALAKRVHRLYRDDFEALDYPASPEAP